MARDLTGQTFSRWTVICAGQKREHLRQCSQIARCACGKVREVLTIHLLDGKSKSCGCYRNEQSKGRLDAAYGLLEMTK